MHNIIELNKNELNTVEGGNYLTSIIKNIFVTVSLIVIPTTIVYLNNIRLNCSKSDSNLKEQANCMRDTILSDLGKIYTFCAKLFDKKEEL